jgi:hypothetical protein
MYCTISELELPVTTLPDKIVQKISSKVKRLGKMSKEGITIEHTRRIPDHKLFYKTCGEVLILFKRNRNPAQYR